jgi:hypothetical protein
MSPLCVDIDIKLITLPFLCVSFLAGTVTILSRWCTHIHTLSAAARDVADTNGLWCFWRSSASAVPATPMNFNKNLPFTPAPGNKGAPPLPHTNSFVSCSSRTRVWPCKTQNHTYVVFIERTPMYEPAVNDLRGFRRRRGADSHALVASAALCGIQHECVCRLSLTIAAAIIRGSHLACDGSLLFAAAVTLLKTSQCKGILRHVPSGTFETLYLPCCTLPSRPKQYLLWRLAPLNHNKQTIFVVEAGPFTSYMHACM